MLSFRDLHKSYGARRVLDGLGHDFGPGVHALQGPNGIGKSTLLAVLAGSVEADAGTVLIDGHDLGRQPLQARARLSYVPDECPVYPFMSGRELLALVARAKRCAVSTEVQALLARFGLGPHLDTRFGAMSLGTQKKTLLAAAWIGEPAVLLLDEPSNGLDQAAREVLAERLRQAHARQAVLLSTHDAAFAQAAGAAAVAFEALRRRADAPA